MNRARKMLVVPLLASLVLTGCFGKKQKPQAGAAAEPDKVLFERAMEDIKHSHYEVARLTLQTLMNTYPDSEYLAKAKLAIADSYYKEGGVAGLTQAVAEYKDFITFFPFLDEAAYAQMQVAMAHYRRMEKPDRDRTEAKLAEDEFQNFLQKYPNHPLITEAEQRLRDVQEVLADGEFRIARFYYIKGSQRAAAARLLELSNRYPLYSQADRALWMLGNLFNRNEKGEVAAQYYSRIVRDYPLSGLVDDAKARLTKLGVPVPQPSAEALARMQRERELERERPGFLRRSLGIIHSGPDVSMAAHSGKPTLTPAEETATATQSGSSGGTLAVGTSGTGGGSAVVETVSPGSPGSTPVPASSTSTSAQASTTTTASSENPPKADPNSSEAKPGTEAAKDDKISGQQEKDKKDDKKKESSSKKKKKGLRKIIPW